MQCLILHFVSQVLGIRTLLDNQKFINRTMFKKIVQARYPTFISTRIIEVNTKSSENLAKLRHTILFRTQLIIIIFSDFQIEKSKFTKRKTKHWLHQHEKNKNKKNEQLYNVLNKHILSYKLQNIISSKTNSDLNNRKQRFKKTFDSNHKNSFQWLCN